MHRKGLGLIHQQNIFILRSRPSIEPGVRDLDLRTRAKSVTQGGERVSSLSRVLLAFAPSARYAG